MVGVLLLIPADSLDPKRPDEHFAREAATANELGITTCLLDHNALTQLNSPETVVRRVRTSSDDAVYRGWMVTADQYSQLDQALRTRDVQLRTRPAAYATAHHLPGWYEAFRDLTPTSVYVDTADLAGIADVVRAALPAGPGVIKDFVKSMKHYWHEAAFVPDVHDDAALMAIVERFVELRGEDLVGGIVVRAFEELIGNEARTWWINGSCALVTAHPDTPDAMLAIGAEISSIASPIRALGAPFVTVDVAYHRDGRLRVIEVGDGQVSDLPSSVNPRQLLVALAGHSEQNGGTSA